MVYLWAVLITTLVGVTRAVPCWEIATSTLQSLDAPGYSYTHTIKYNNALDPDGPWDIVRAQDCYVRFQEPRDGGDGRITKTVFEATPSQVLTTMMNYFNGGSNIALWLPMNSRAFEYGMIINLARAGGNHEAFDGQGSLGGDALVMSIILPSGASKLKRVNPPSGECTYEQKVNVAAAQSGGIVGLEGNIDSADWAYSNSRAARMAMQTLRHRQSRNRNNALNVPSWLLATKTDGECVVIDLTGFVDFFF
ncbi:uncharacterized protein RSE6_01574 [Rhynchosporium secalis]|uniref:Uncharacterized protein n=1 Tax=Rhynchosporium secalis TaxID=38038 RepID=A0A1E1LY51_RHYSE|nr:uncharacterized protein RSE6_01574 [Rhynchosporium secalis]